MREARGLFVPVQGVHLGKEATTFKVPLILVMFVSELHIDLEGP
jgi:hypothetical protein